MEQAQIQHIQSQNRYFEAAYGRLEKKIWEKIMSVTKIVKTIKEVHKDYIILVKIGAFYHAYGKDAYILNYLFQYQLKLVDKTCFTNGFPESSLNKVMATLEREKINYMILDRRNNYEVDKQENYKNLNNYSKKYEKARRYVNLKNRIDNIYFFYKKIYAKKILRSYYKK